MRKLLSEFDIDAKNDYFPIEDDDILVYSEISNIISLRNSSFISGKLISLLISHDVNF